MVFSSAVAVLPVGRGGGAAVGSGIGSVLLVIIFLVVQSQLGGTGDGGSAPQDPGSTSFA